MMNIGIDTAVYCVDHFCGFITTLILNPASFCLTYLVVKRQSLPARSTRTERLVPIHLAIARDVSGINLSCTMAVLAEMSPFRATHYIEVDPSDDRVKHMLWPPTPLGKKITMPVEQQHVPNGEITIGRDTQVDATDGHVGRFDYFVVEGESGRVTYLVFQWGHLWEQKRVTIPVAELTYVQNNTIYLNLDRRTVAKLPSRSLR